MYVRKTTKFTCKDGYCFKANSSVVVMKKSHRIALLAFELALIVIFSLMPINLGAASLALTLLPVLVIALTQDFKTAVLGGLIMGVTSLIGAFTVGAGSLTAPLFRNPLVSVIPRICVPAAAWGINKGLCALATKIKEKSVEKKNANACVSEEYAETNESADEVKDVADNGKKAPSDKDKKSVADNGKKAPSDKDKKSVAVGKPLSVFIDGVSSALGVCANTALVLGMIWLLYKGKTVGDSAITPEFMMGLISLNFVIEVIVMTALTPPIVYAIRKQQEKNR